MSVKSVEKKEKNTAEIVLEVSSEKFESALNSAYNKRKGSFMLPGFRKGKAPRKMIERMYGESIFYEDAVNIIFPEVFAEAVEQEKLQTVGRPSVTDLNVSDDKILTLTVTTALYPEVELGEYKGLTAEMDEVEVTDADIDREIAAVRERNGRISPVERPVQMGDTAVIDFEGFTDGKAFEGGKGENYDLTIGSGQFIPGFEEQIIGMSAGEEKEINIKFPDNYAAELAGKDAVFKIKLHEVKENILPELDDEFAKDVSEFDTFEEYRKSIADNLKEQRQNSAKERFTDALVDKAIDNMKVDIPEAMIEENIDNLIQDYEYRLASQGMTLEKYLEMMGMTEAGFRTASRPMAEKRVKTSLLFKKIAEVENLVPTPEELEAEYERMASSYGVDKERVKTVFGEELIADNKKLDMARDLIRDTGIAEKSAPKAEEEKAE